MSDFKGYGGDELLDPKELLRKLRHNGRYVIYVVIVLLVLVGLYNSYYTVEADEEAVVLRFGKPLGEPVGPGLHFRVPIVDEVFKGQTKKIRQLEFGFRTEVADVKSRVNETIRTEGLMLTGDLELVNVQWTVLYQISDLEDYLFNVRDVEETIRDISSSVVRLLVGDRSSDEVMTTMRGEVAARAKEMVQASLDRCASGIKVEDVALRQVEPPKDAQEAFNKVNEARARKQQTIEMAKREKEARIAPMEGRRDAIVAKARGKRDRVIKEAAGEANKFLSVLAEYEKRAAVTKQWLYLQAMLRVWQRVGRKFVLDEANNALQLLPLGELGLGGSRVLAPPTHEAPKRDDEIAPEGADQGEVTQPDDEVQKP